MRTRRLRVAIALLAPLWWCLAAPSARACGGPAQVAVGGVLYPLDVSAICSPEDGYDVYYLDQFLFLYPFRLTLGDSLESLWQSAYGSGWTPPGTAAGTSVISIKRFKDGTSTEGFGSPASWSFDDEPQLASVTFCQTNYRDCKTITRESWAFVPDMSPFTSAVQAHDWPAAKKAAAQVVEQFLDQPQSVAQARNDELKRAVEYLELEPFIGEIGDERASEYFFSTARPPAESELSPTFRRALAIRYMPRADAGRVLAEDPRQARAASLRFVVLQQELREQIPNGWTPMPEDAALRLDGMIDEWLKDYPDHPLRDLVVLLKVRVKYFQSRGGNAALEMLLDMYPRHLKRVLVEMRYILVNRGAMLPLESLEKRSPPDPVLITALTPADVDLGATGWTRLWKLSESQPQAPWSVNLQERLLRAAGAMSPLPEGFPAEAKAPTQLWGMLRLVALERNQQWQEALKQAAATPANEQVAQLAATAHLALGHVKEAALVEGLSPVEKDYLLQVLLSDAELQSLLRGGIGADAALSLGMRRAAAGEWAAAARDIEPFDAERAALWRTCAKLSSDRSPAGLLRWARFLKANYGRIFPETDTAWERSLSWDYALSGSTDPNLAARRSVRSPWTLQYRHQAVERHLLQNEMWLALNAYAQVLVRAPRSPEAPAALHEADECYNWLLNHCQNCSDFWQNFLDRQPAVEQLRKAGRKIRAQVTPMAP